MFVKDPDAVLDYRVDWGDALVAGLAIVSSEWRIDPVEPGGIGIGSHAVAGAVAAATLTAGLRGHVYRAGNRVTFSDGMVDERSVVIRVEER